MSDQNTSLPVRTETNGDVAAKIVDGTTVSQALAVDATGLIGVKNYDGAGNALTSQTNGGQRALDIGIDVGGVQIDPRVIRALTSADVVTANQGTPAAIGNAWYVRPTDGTNSQSFTAAGEAKVDITQPLPAGANNIGSVNQGTSPWITKDQSDGPVTPGTVASFSQLMGGQFNTSLPTLTNGQQAAIQVDSSGRLLTTSSSTDDHNYGTVGASTLRTAAQIGNATGAANFGAGATTAQTLRVSANILDATGTAFSNTNPLPVFVSAVPGTRINDFKNATAIAAAGSDNHDYTVTAGKTLTLSSVLSSASGKAKMHVEVETGVATNVFTTYFIQFNSTATSNMEVRLTDPILVAAGVRVRVVMDNKDLTAQDLYSTICGTEN